MDLPFVSIIIPCRNERKFIGKCLTSIIDQDYPKEKMEVLVVDGMSEDGTREVMEDHAKKDSGIRILDNPGKIAPKALNIGIRAARGDVIIRMDAHNIYEKDYVTKCAKYLYEYGADNVGGVFTTLPGSATLMASSIALSLSHPFGVGNAYFRIGSTEPKYVDTVPFGCYKKEVFEKIGLFDEDLIRNQDDEFNLRLIKNGGKILLVPEIASFYHARDSLVKLTRMYFQYGYFKPLVALKVGGVLTWRQLIPVFFVGSLIGLSLLSLIFKPFLWLFVSILSLYLTANLAFSLQISMKKGLEHLFLLPIVFSTLHFSYGIGYLKGIWDFIVLKKHKKKKIEEVPLTR